MRSSDWSSDVCSSDLLHQRAFQPAERRTQVGRMPAAIHLDAEHALGAEPCGQPADRGANLRVAADPADGAVVFGHAAYDSRSSSSMKPEMMQSPLDQKAGSEASSPKGCSSSMWRREIGSAACREREGQYV